MRKYCNHPGCNFETEDTTVNFCPFGHGVLSVDSESLSLGNKNSGNASKVNIGMGGAVAGDINSVTTNHYTTSEKTIAEIHRESIRHFTQFCDEICKDGLLDEERLFRLNDLRIKLELSEADTKPVIDMILKKNKKKSTVLPPVGKTILEQTKFLIAQNNTSELTLHLKDLRGWMNQYNVEELKQNYYQLYAILEPTSYVCDLEKYHSDEYWQVFWGHVAYLKLDRRDRAQAMLAQLGQWRNYSEENQAVLYAIGIMMLGSDRKLIVRSLDLLKPGGWTPDLKPVVEAMSALVDTSAETISQSYMFYATSLFSKFSEKQKEQREKLKKEKEENERKALEAERIKQQQIRKADDDAWMKAVKENTLDSLSEYLKNGRFHVEEAHFKLDALRKELEKRQKMAVDEENWKAAKSENTIESYLKYLKIGSLYADEARKRIEKIERDAAEAEKRAADDALWETAKQINTKESYSDYIKKGCYHVEEAQRLIKRFEEEERARQEAEKKAKEAAEKAIKEAEMKRLEEQKRAEEKRIADEKRRIEKQKLEEEQRLEEQKREQENQKLKQQQQDVELIQGVSGKTILVLIGVCLTIIIIVVAQLLDAQATRRRDEQRRWEEIQRIEEDKKKAEEEAAKAKEEAAKLKAEVKKAEEERKKREDEVKKAALKKAAEEAARAKNVAAPNAANKANKSHQKLESQPKKYIRIGNLEWSKRSRNEMNWNEAKQYCANLTEGGYSDWRLPNIDELRTTIKNCPKTEPGGECKVSEKNGCLSSQQCGNARSKDSCGCEYKKNNGGYYSKLGDHDGVYLWSSSTLVGSANRAWAVDFDDGGVSNLYKTNNYDVRCVR